MTDPDPTTRRPRLLHFLPSVKIESGGVTRAVLDAVRLCQEQGLPTTLATFDPLDIPKSWLAGESGTPKVVVLPTRLRGGRFTEEARDEIRKLLDGADVLHVHGPWALSNYQICGLAKAAKVPWILSIHGMLNDWSMQQRGLRKRLFLAGPGRRTLGQATLLHYTAESEREQARKHAPHQRDIVVPYLFDTEQFADLPPASDADALLAKHLPADRLDKPVVLFLSRLHEKKGTHLLPAILKAMTDGGSDASLVLAGTGRDGYVGPIRREFEQLGLADRVAFVGLVSGDEKLALYRRADVMLFPTLEENFGLVLPESMACQTPVVTTRGSSFWREVEAGGGIICETEPQPLAEATNKLLADDAERERLGRVRPAMGVRHAFAGQADAAMAAGVRRHRPIAFPSNAHQVSSTLMSLPLAILRSYADVAPTERGGFRLARLARKLVPRDQWQGTFGDGRGNRLDLDLSTYPDIAMACGLYERDTDRLFEKLLRPGMHFVDGGANLGYFTCRAARRVGSTGRVDAFEPDPDNRARLLANLQRNALSHVRVHPVALSDEQATLTFHHPVGGDRNHGETSRFNIAGVETTSFDVPAVRADEAVNGVPDVVKLDLEGGELAAVRGMTAWLAADRPPAVILEHNPPADARGGHRPGDVWRAFL